MGFRDVSDVVTLTKQQVNTCVEMLQQEHQRCQLPPLSHKSSDIWFWRLDILGRLYCTHIYFVNNTYQALTNYDLKVVGY